VREAFMQRARERVEERRAMIERCGVERVSIDAASSYERPLLSFFRQRARRARR
jgi:hypothetical protein